MTLTNMAGKSIRAQVLSVSGKEVTFKTEGGAQFVVPLNSLCEADQRMLATWKPKMAALAKDSADHVEKDLSEMLLKPTLWKGEEALAGVWCETSQVEEEVMARLDNPASFLGFPLDSVDRIMKQGQLKQLVLVFLEEGNFVGYRERGATTPGKRAKDEVKDSVAKLQEAFERRFNELEEKLPMRINTWIGAKSEWISLGTGSLRKRLRQWQAGELVLNLELDEGHLIALTVQRASDFNRRFRMDDEAFTDRSRKALGNLIILPNGDHQIENVPMIEQGSRGYCAMGTLTMLARYYGLDLKIDAMAAAAGYSAGAPVEGEAVLDVYQRVARLGRLRFEKRTEFDFLDVARSLDRGEPVLIWRWFSRARDQFHTQFAEQQRSQPDARFQLSTKVRSRPFLPDVMAVTPP